MPYSNRVLCDKLLGSCWKFSILKRRRHFFTLFDEHVNIFVIVYIYIYNCHLLRWVYKKIIFSSLFTPWVFIQKFISILDLFLEWIGGNSLKRKYVEGAGRFICKMNKDEQGGSRSKIRSFEWTYFLNDPKVFSLELKSIC